MSKKFFLAKIGLLLLMAIFVVKWIKRFEGCNPKEKCVGNNFPNDETGSGYLETIEESLRSPGLQSVIQDIGERQNTIQGMDSVPLMANNKNVSSVVSVPGELQMEDDNTPRKSTEDGIDSEQNKVKISDILTFPRRLRSSGFRDIIQGKAGLKKSVSSIKKGEAYKTTVTPFVTKMVKTPSLKKIQFEPEQDGTDENEREGDDDNDNDDNDDENQDDVTIYQPKRTSECPGNTNRHILRDLLSMWDQKAKKHGILYFLAYGSLLGYHRNGDVLPWDTDVDVFVQAESYGQIRDIAVPRNFKYEKHDKTARIVIQTDVRFPSENRTRVSCDGRVVSRSIDGCSFQDPIARVVRGNRHLDIFAVYHLNTTLLYEPILNHFFDASEFYPTKPCVFMGVKTNCPFNVPAVLRRKYGAGFNVPAKVCVDGQWKNRVN